VIPAGVEILVATAPIDLRWSFDRLAGLAKAELGREARCGALFVFFGRRRDALKSLFFDGSGMCQLYKRLDKGTFRLPESLVPGARQVEIAPHALDALLDGVELEPAPARPRGGRRRPTGKRLN
jgi:transposase